MHPKLDVHHIIPVRDFNGDMESAHDFDNLITLCRSCHKYVEHHTSDAEIAAALALWRAGHHGPAYLATLASTAPTPSTSP